MQKFYSIGLFMLLNGLVVAQTPVATSRILANQLSTLQEKTPQLNFLTEENQGMPLLRELEFRTETNEWLPSQQEIGFRINFNGKGMRKVQDAINLQRLDQYSIRQLEQTEERLFLIYQYLIEHHYTYQQLQLLTEQQRVLADKKKVYERMMATAEVVEINEVLKAERELQRIARKLLQTRQQLASTSQLLAIEEAADLSSGWVTLAGMHDLVNQSDTFQQAALVLQEQEVLSAQLDSEMEHQEGKQLLNFVNIKQSGRNRLNFGQEFSIGVGLAIPLKSTNRVKYNEAILDLLDEEQELNTLKQKINERISSHSWNFNSAREEHRLLNSMIDNSRLQDILDAYLVRSDVHPLDLLRIKENMLDDQQDLVELELKACYHYLEVVYYRGLLFATPNVNFLSNNLEKITIE